MEWSISLRELPNSFGIDINPDDWYAFGCEDCRGAEAYVSEADERYHFFRPSHGVDLSIRHLIFLNQIRGVQIPVDPLLLTKAVIPAAGLGTRLLSATKEQPKEMLPVFSRTKSGELCLKPIVQLVFEQLYEAGFREFCFIVGKEKRAIEDQLTPDLPYVAKLQKLGKTGASEDLRAFYEMIEQSTLVWINQPEPRGFGDAVLKSKSFVAGDSFLVHAGDSYVHSPNSRHLERLRRTSDVEKADAAFLAMRVPDPRRYGVVEGAEEDGGLVRVSKLVEKPQKPASNLAIMPVYAFHSVILKALEVTTKGVGGEIQLTDGIQKLVDWGLSVRAVELEKTDVRLDIGSPELYWEAQNLSYGYSVVDRRDENKVVAPLIETRKSAS